MFSKQAIRSFQKQLDELGPEDHKKLTVKNMSLLIGHIQKAQKYYMGNGALLKSIDNIREKNPGKKAFFGEWAQDVKLPFNHCWFDFHDDNILSHVFPNHKPPTVRIGIYAGRCNPEADKEDPEIIQLMPCYSYGSTKHWVLCNNVYSIKIGHNFLEKEAISLSNSIFPKLYPTERSKHIQEIVSSYIIKTPIVDLDDIDATEPVKEYMQYIGKTIEVHACITLNIFLMIVNCQNVVTETISTFKQKKSKKLFKNKGVTYKVLKFKLPKSSKRYDDKSKRGQEPTLPLHICSGHFKTYTEDRPLFGKVAGRWWWHDQVRGRKENGIVNKDYHPERK